MKTTAERLTFRQEANDIYFAADDYLIEKHTGAFETEQAQTNITYLAAFMEKMSETYDSAHLTAMVVPNAVDILRDKLPPFASPYDEETYLDQIKAALPQGVWFDTSGVLEQHKEKRFITARTITGKPWPPFMCSRTGYRKKDWERRPWRIIRSLR